MERLWRRAQHGIARTFSGFNALRIFVFVLGAVFVTVGLATLRYNTLYLLLSPLWASLFVVSGVLTILFGIKHHMVLGAVSGAVMAAGCFMRSLAILVELGFTGWKNVVFPWRTAAPLEASFFIASVQWFIIALLLLMVWPVILLSAKDPK